MKRRSNSKVGCRIYYSLLILSYLEVVLWTSCLVGSVLAGAGGTVDGQQYLHRETSNLKFAGQLCLPPLLAVDFRGADLHKQLEQAALQRLFDQFQAYAYSSDHVFRQPLSSGYTKKLSGLPAAFAGVDALD